MTRPAANAAVGVLFCFLAGASVGAERNGLFAAAERPAAAVPNPAAVALPAKRSRWVRLDMSQLAESAAPGAAETEPPASHQTLTLNLFDDARFVAIVERRVPVLSGHMLRGRLGGAQRGRWTLVVRDGTATGTVLTADRAYVLDAGAEGRHLVSEVDRSLFPPDDPNEEWRVRMPPDPPGELRNRRSRETPYRPAPPSPADVQRSHNNNGTDLPSVGGRWLPIGPAPILEGQVENVSPNNEVTGAIHTVLAHPTNADILYIGAVNGGIWRTNNATAVRPDWHPLTDDFHSLSIGAMAFDPDDPNTILAGIGRYSSFGRAGGDRVGLLLSNDGGETWRPLDLPFGDPISKNISGVAVDGDRLVASAGPSCCTSVYRSLDGGTTWREAEGLPANGAMDLVVDPTDRDRFYVTMSERGVFRSDDGGASWLDISSHDATLRTVFTEPVFDEQGVEGRNNNAEMALASNGRLYLAVLVAGQAHYIGFTDDQGATWNAMDLPLTPEADGSEVGLNPRFKPGGQGAIHFSIRADPTDPNIVYVGGDRQDFGCVEEADGFVCSSFIGATNFTGRLFRGNTAVAPTGEVPSPQWQHLTHRSDIEAIPGGGTASSSAPHADSREMVFDANGDIIQVDDGGIYRRTSPGNNSGDWFSLNGNLQVTEMHDIAYDPLAEVVIGGNQDTGTVQQSSTADAVWATVEVADGGDVTVDASNAPNYSIRYSSIQVFRAFRRMLYDAANELVDRQWPALDLNGVSVYETNPGFHFVQPVILNAVEPRRAVLPAASIYETDDRFDTLTESYAFDRGSYERASAAAYGCSANPDLLYIGHSGPDGNDVSVRTSLGADATPTPDDFQVTPYPGGYPRDILINPNDCAAVYVADGSEVYASHDTGATWRRITGNLVDIPVTYLDLRSLEFVPNGGPLASAAVLVAGRGGVHVMYTGEESVWLAMNQGLPNAPAADLDYDATDDVLVVSTLGRGAWRLQAGPTVVRQIDDVTAEVGDAEPTVSIAGVFEDRAGGGLTYSVESADETIATVRIDGDVIRVTPRAAGVVVITLAARDARGGTGASVFTVTVGAVLNIAASTSAPEGATARLAVTLSRPLDEAIEVGYALTMDDDRNTRDADADDYVQMHGTTTIAASATAGTVEIAIADDDVTEPLREAFAVHLTAPERNPDYGLGLQTTATVTIDEGVCDRTESLRDAVVETLGAATCAAVDDLTGIVTLDLSGRGIDRLKPLDFIDMTALTHLDLSRNALTELSNDSFAGPFSLQTLSLRSNQLTALPDYVFESVPNLRQIHLSGNRLTALPRELFSNNSLLTELHLNDNALAALPVGIFSGLHMLRALQLQNNPGTPFALAIDLARTDANPWQPSSPATIVATMRQGAPFAMDVDLTVAGGSLSAMAATLATGDTASNPVSVAQIGNAAAEVHVRVPSLPSENYDGFTIVAGEPLLLFKARPQALLVPAVPPLEAGGDAIVFHLATLLVDFDSDQLTYTATSADASVATVHIDGDLLAIMPVEDGTTTVTVTATDADGLSGTLVIQLTVEPMLRFLRSWRLPLLDRD